MSEPIDELTALEKAAGAGAYQRPDGHGQATARHSFAPVELSWVADIHTILQAVRSELSMQQPREDLSRSVKGGNAPRETPLDTNR